MTNEEKELLIKVLCAMLPYGVMIHVEHDWFEDEVPPYDALLTVECHSILNNFCENPLTCCFIIKPYLRSFEDMTEEEKEELRLLKDSFDFNCYTAGNYSFQVNLAVAEWLIKNHFDYRGLIPMGLALKASEGMYK